MGPNITNNESGKFPYALVIYCNNNLSIFNCCSHDADVMDKFVQFLLKVDKSIMKHLSPWWKERGATATNPKMMPRQHIGSDSSWRYRCKRKSDESVTCDRRWGDPGYRVPTRWWHGNEEKHARDNFGHGANISISYNKAFGPRTSSRCYTFEACVSGGSSS